MAPIIESLGIHSIEIDIHEVPLSRKEANMECLDFPRFHFLINGDNVFSTRFCMAICVGGMSTKLWSRIGIPSLKHSKNKYGISINELPNCTSIYRSLNEKTSEWLFQILENIVNESLSTERISRHGWIEISSFGVDNKNLLEYTEQLSQNEMSMEEILSDPKANEVLSSYFLKVTDIEGQLYDFVTMPDVPKHSWFVLPVPIMNKWGYAEERNVLFFMRPLENRVEVIGFGHDDSIDGKLAHASVTKMSIWSGPKI